MPESLEELLVDQLWFTGWASACLPQSVLAHQVAHSHYNLSPRSSPFGGDARTECYISPKREREQELAVQPDFPLPGQAGAPRGCLELPGPGLFEMTRATELSLLP